MDSDAFPHESQMQSLVIFLFFRFSLVAKIFLHAFLAKCLIFFSTFISQRCLHVCFKVVESKLSGVLPLDCIT